MTRKTDKAQKPDGRGGRYVLLPHCVLTSEAWRTASPRSIKILLAILQRHNGFNNGAIALSMRDLAAAIDCQNHAANALALGELVTRGLLELMRRHPRGSRLSDEWRLTFIPTGDGSATHEYIGWKVGDAGTQSKRQPQNKAKSRVVVIATEKGLSVAAIATELKRRVVTTATDETNNDEKPPFPVLASVATTATHIGCQSPSRSQSKVVSLNRRTTPSAAPDPGELRERVKALIAEQGRGTQGRLAVLAGISGASMSRFLGGGIDLDERARVRVTCAVPKLANYCVAAQ